MSSYEEFGIIWADGETQSEESIDNDGIRTDKSDDYMVISTDTTLGELLQYGLVNIKSIIEEL